VELVALRTRLDRLELFLPVRWCCLQRHVVSADSTGVRCCSTASATATSSGSSSRSCTSVGVPRALSLKRSSQVRHPECETLESSTGEIACLTGDHGGVLHVDHGEENIDLRGAGVLVLGAVIASSAPGA
jgi:hypothetical protein